MRVIIAGGRDYNFTDADSAFLDTLPGITEVVCGCARGADTCGRDWAKARGVPFKDFPADWVRFGNKRAGPIRNAEMAEYADGAILFPGGNGTLDMKRQMIRRNKPVVEVYGK